MNGHEAQEHGVSHADGINMGAKIHKAGGFQCFKLVFITTT